VAGRPLPLVVVGSEGAMRWRWIGRGILAVTVLAVLALAQYTLPQAKVVRIVGTENRRIDFGWNAMFWAAPDAGSASGVPAAAARDVFFIQTVGPDGAPHVFRNEDTGWGWPPFLKFNSHNLQAEATNLTSAATAPVWVAISHYGWRSQWLTIFPNALSVRQVDGPDADVFPWGSAAVLGAVLVALLALWRIAVLLYRTYVAPIAGRIGRFFGR
jgi:hypothetical protein